ncbi:MAG: hypothetical protein E6767_20315, partial [Dysgonomonas sp.]|nr:hypothetical protein [Dysgonomonas sp.]
LKFIVWNTNGSTAYLDKCPMINFESLQFMVDQALPPATGILTIILHPDAYARLTPELIATATAKNITFATA